MAGLEPDTISSNAYIQSCSNSLNPDDFTPSNTFAGMNILQKAAFAFFFLTNANKTLISAAAYRAATLLCTVAVCDLIKCRNLLSSDADNHKKPGYQTTLAITIFLTAIGLVGAILSLIVLCAAHTAAHAADIALTTVMPFIFAPVLAALALREIYLLMSSKDPHKRWHHASEAMGLIGLVIGVVALFVMPALTLLGIPVTAPVSLPIIAGVLLCVSLAMSSFKPQQNPNATFTQSAISQSDTNEHNSFWPTHAHTTR